MKIQTSKRDEGQWRWEGSTRAGKWQACGIVSGNTRAVYMNRMWNDAFEDMSAGVLVMKGDGYRKGNSIDAFRHDR